MGKKDAGPSPEEIERLEKEKAEQAESIRRSSEAYSNYIVESGVAAQLSRVLVGLYESGERPDNVVDWAEKYLGTATGVEVLELKGQNDILKKRNQELTQRTAYLEKEVQTLQEERARALADAED